MVIANRQKDLGGMGVRHTRTITTNQCGKTDFHGLTLLANMLQSIASSPDISSPGGKHFDTLHVHYEGNAWVAVMESTVEP